MNKEQVVDIKEQLKKDAEVMFFGEASADQEALLKVCCAGGVVVETYHSEGVLESLNLTTFLNHVKNHRPNWQYEWSKILLNENPSAVLPRGFLVRSRFNPKVLVSKPSEHHI